MNLYALHAGEHDRERVDEEGGGSEDKRPSVFGLMVDHLVLFLSLGQVIALVSGFVLISILSLFFGDVKTCIFFGTTIGEIVALAWCLSPR